MNRPSRLPDHDVMVGAILETYGRSVPADRAAGSDWYPTAGTMVRAIAEHTGRPADRVAYALAALSPRNPWRWNVQDCYAFAAAAARGDAAPPTATTFGDNVTRAWSALADDGAPWTTAAPKVRAFVSAILGDTGAVVVDVWAIRVATAGRLSDVRDHEYAAVVAAYRDAADALGENAASVQAVTWIVAQSAGTGSRRRGRHDRTFKRGTAPLVLALFGHGEPMTFGWSE